MRSLKSQSIDIFRNSVSLFDLYLITIRYAIRYPFWCESEQSQKSLSVRFGCTEISEIKSNRWRYKYAWIYVFLSILDLIFIAHSNRENRTTLSSTFCVSVSIWYRIRTTKTIRWFAFIDSKNLQCTTGKHTYKYRFVHSDSENQRWHFDSFLPDSCSTFALIRNLTLTLGKTREKIRFSFG